MQIQPTHSTESNLLTSELKDKIHSIFEDGTSKNTIIAYKSDIEYILNWAEISHLEANLPLVPDTVLRFIIEHSEGIPTETDEQLVNLGFKARLGPHKVSTIDRAYSRDFICSQNKRLPKSMRRPKNKRTDEKGKESRC